MYIVERARPWRPIAAETSGTRTDTNLMRYLRYTYDPPLARQIVAMLAEFDDDGYVQREIGFDGAGHVVHRKPSEIFREGRFGYFDDLFLVDDEITLGTAKEVSRDVFERQWLLPDHPPAKAPGLLSRLLRRRDQRPEGG